MLVIIGDLELDQAAFSGVLVQSIVYYKNAFPAAIKIFPATVRFCQQVIHIKNPENLAQIAFFGILLTT
jgi:hypothetical protein